MVKTRSHASVWLSIHSFTHIVHPYIYIFHPFTNPHFSIHPSTFFHSPSSFLHSPIHIINPYICIFHPFTNPHFSIHPSTLSTHIYFHIVHPFILPNCPSIHLSTLSIHIHTTILSLPPIHIISVHLSTLLILSSVDNVHHSFYCLDTCNWIVHSPTLSIYLHCSFTLAIMIYPHCLR